MGTLTTKGRKDLPGGDFAGPNRTYPIEDKAHARDAMARASEAANMGTISRQEQHMIDRKAEAILKGHKKAVEGK